LQVGPSATNSASEAKSKKTKGLIGLKQKLLGQNFGHLKF
jgi:hypothetical protein